MASSSAPAKLPIPAAKLLSSNPHVVPGQLVVTEQWFEVPLDYENPSAGTIRLFGRTGTKRETPIIPPDEEPAPKPYIVYLQGGPGFGCPQPQDFPAAKVLIDRGYQVLMLDHRGVGLSTPVSTEMLQRLPGGEDAQYHYLRLMRQDNTVRDCEAVRMCLTAGLSGPKAQWSIIGQSYGGFIALSYLSMHPEGLREAFLTGGLAPVGQTAEQQYARTYGHVAKRNAQYFAKFPEDVAALRQIATFIESQEGGGVKMPGGGLLTVPRLMTIGISFVGHGGFDSVHAILLQLKASLDSFGFLSRTALTAVAAVTPLDNNIIYAILHEAIYCDGPGCVSNWAAHRVGQSLDNFWWLQPGASVANTDKPLLFAGEMMYPFLFETLPELIPLRNLAERLAKADDWPALYDQEQMKKNKVPVYCASYVDDMAVDYGYGSATARMIGAKTFETNVMYHNAVRAKVDEVMTNLFALRDDTLD
ncbi:hypothetical protein K4F52_007990 [Lecanicillium sp. MT-2017a]|nr:hypothetical protein K4F52_007990 [Lecanicillium sp. MT-2017a]